MKEKTKVGLPWTSLVILSLMTFLAIISELLPSGLLNQMSESLGISEARTGSLVGVYSLPAAILAIPAVKLAAGYDRKIIMQISCLGFFASTFIVAWSNNYTIALIGRLIGGSLAGLFWPLVSAYAGELVRQDHSGRAVTIVLSGATLGVSLGLPIFTKIGQLVGWRMAFVILGLGYILLAILGYKYLPSVSLAKSEENRSVKEVLSNVGIRRSILVVVMMVLGQYTTYVFIQLICQKLAIDLNTSQIIFGLGCVLMVALVGGLIDRWLGHLLVLVFVLAIIVMGVFAIGRGPKLLMYLAMFVWGLSYGPMSTLLQNATMNQVEEGKDIASAIKTTGFDGAIMLSSLIGGWLLNRWGIQANMVFAIVMYLGALLVVLLSRKYFFNK